MYLFCHFANLCGLFRLVDGPLAPISRKLVDHAQSVLLPSVHGLDIAKHRND